MPEPSREALALQGEAIVIDLHADTFELVAALGYDLAKEHRSFAALGHLLGHIDVPRMRRGGVTAQLFGVVITPWSGRRGAARKVERQGELADEACRRLPDDLVRARTAAEVLAAREAGKIALLLGVEASHGLADNEEALDQMVRHRVCYAGPAHLFDSPAAPSHLWHRGGGPLAAAGRRYVEALRERGVLVDLAHLPRDPFLELCRSARAPLLVSHTGCAALHPIWRNIDDEQIRAVAGTGGVVGVIMTPRYLGRPGVEGVADHLEHLLKVGGEDLAALGSDFDGLIRPPRDLVDVAGLPLITDALLRRGLPERTIRKVLGENALRLLAA